MVTVQTVVNCVVGVFQMLVCRGEVKRDIENPITSAIAQATFNTFRCTVKLVTINSKIGLLFKISESRMAALPV